MLKFILFDVRIIPSLVSGSPSKPALMFSWYVPFDFEALTCFLTGVPDTIISLAQP